MSPVWKGVAGLGRHLFLWDLPSPVGRWRWGSRECLLAEMLVVEGFFTGNHMGQIVFQNQADCVVSLAHAMWLFLSFSSFILLMHSVQLTWCSLKFLPGRNGAIQAAFWWQVAVNAGPRSPSWVLLFLLQSSGPKVVYLLLIKHRKSLLVASCYFQDEERAQTDLYHLVWTWSSGLFYA